MGSGGSKGTLIQVAPKDQENDGIVNDSIVNKADAKQRKKTSLSKDAKDDKNKECSLKKTENTPEEPTLAQGKKRTDENVIVTPENVEEVLKSKGFDNVVLLSHCRETPEMVETFVKIFEHVQNIREKIEEEEDDFIDALNKDIKGISSVYQSAKKTFRIKKGNLLAELGFADVYKDIVDKLLCKYPRILSVVKFESAGEKNEDNANGSADSEKNTDNTNGTRSEKNTDNTNGTGSEKNTDNTNGTGSEKNTDNTNGTGSEKNTDNTIGTGSEKNTDNTIGTGSEKNTDNTNETGSEKNTDNTNGTGSQKNTDNTNGSDPEKNTDNSNRSGGEKNIDNTDPDIDKAKKELKKARVFLQILIRISINYTDLCDAMCIAFSKAGLVPIWVHFVEQLRDCTAFHLKWVDDNGNLKKKTDRGIILSCTLGTMHNMSKRIPTRASFHACNAITSLVPYLDDPIAFFATKALLSLAYLIDESNEELIKSKEEPITFMLSILQKAIAKQNKRHIGLSSSEIANALAQISINDSNKKLIVTHGAIPVLMRMIMSANDDEERIEAIGALWSLAFDEDNRIKMRETEGSLELLKSMKSSNNKKITTVVNGALWEIEGKQSHASEESTASNGPMKSHIMISYQWDVQKLMIQVKNRLQSAGFKVWMDLEQMGGSTLAAMAEAVENSAVILVCISQRYKESANCRSEAEYAFQLKKDIVPLMVEKNYTPTGWLGMILGSKLWIDFTQGLRRLDTSAKELMRELGTRGKEGEQPVTAITADTVDAPISKSQPKVDISGWTNSDVMKWIDTFDIETKEKNSLHKLNGTMLMLLHSLRSESPDYYYASLKDDIGLYDVCSVLRFTHELEKLCG